MRIRKRKKKYGSSKKENNRASFCVYLGASDGAQWIKMLWSTSTKQE